MPSNIDPNAEHRSTFGERQLERANLEPSSKLLSSLRIPPIHALGPLPEEQHITTLNEALLAEALAWTLQPQSLAALRLKQTLGLISACPTLTFREQGQLGDLLVRLVEDPNIVELRLRDRENPLYHHTQVLYNMTWFALAEKERLGLDFSELKNLFTLALLHDIGTGDCTTPKVYSSEVETAIKAAELADETNVAELKDRVFELVGTAVAFRLEHMHRGMELLPALLEPYRARGDFSSTDIERIRRTIAVHDYPSIERVFSRLRKRAKVPESSFGKPGQYLLPLSDPYIGNLLTLQREADRFDMITLTGVIFNVQRSKPSGELSEIDLAAIKQQGNKNVKSHLDEGQLYADAALDDGKFLQGSLYRTPTGYQAFEMARRRYL